MLRLGFRRLLHALDNHGLPGLLGRVLTRLRPTRRAPGPESDPQILHPYDVVHGTDTSGYVHGEQLAANLPADLYNTAYYAISPSTLRDALSRVPAGLDGFTFVDLGCGKGRALLVASEVPFARIVGVEIAESLATVARANTVHDPRIVVLTADATSVRFPAGPLLVYLYHPFLAPVLKRVLRNLRQELHQTPRPAYLLYANPTYPKVMARFPFLRPVWDLRFALSPDDHAIDRHGVTHERYTLHEARPD